MPCRLPAVWYRRLSRVGKIEPPNRIRRAECTRFASKNPNISGEVLLPVEVVITQCVAVPDRNDVTKGKLKIPRIQRGYGATSASKTAAVLEQGNGTQQAPPRGNSWQ